MDAAGELAPFTDEKQLQVAEKVLRRAEISRITRNLKSRLALASFKTKRGWESLCLDSIEPRLQSLESTFQGNSGNEINGSSVDEISPKRDFYHAFPHSSPARSPPSQFSQQPLLKPSALLQPAPALGPHQSSDSNQKPVAIISPTGKRVKVMVNNKPTLITTTKPTLPGESPLRRGPISTATATTTTPTTNTTTNTTTSTITAAATTPPSNNSNLLLPPPSSFIKTPRISPPKTPPPKHRNPQSLSSDRDGADLLMYLATSPSPAQRNSNNNLYGQYPASSPFNRPSTALNAPHTPQQGFNFNDYLNITTPSPAQLQRTPDRPLLRSARQRLNFDHIPETSSTGPSAASRFSSHLSSSEDSTSMVA